MGWKITKDIINKQYPRSGDDETGLESGSNPYKGGKLKIKVYDDDGELYFHALTDEYNFDFLDDFGHSYGCTEIRYFDFENGKWRKL